MASLLRFLRNSVWSSPLVFSSLPLLLKKLCVCVSSLFCLFCFLFWKARHVWFRLAKSQPRILKIVTFLGRKQVQWILRLNVRRFVVQAQLTCSGWAPFMGHGPIWKDGIPVPTTQKNESFISEWHPLTHLFNVPFLIKGGNVQKYCNLWRTSEIERSIFLIRPSIITSWNGYTWWGNLTLGINSLHLSTC